MTDTVEHTKDLGNTKPNPTPRLRSRGWCFTLNNYSDTEVKILESYGHSNTVKFVIGKEKAPTTGTEHLQGYFYHKNSRTLESMKKINGRAHWEKSRGSPEENLTYCTKADENATVAG